MIRHGRRGDGWALVVLLLLAAAWVAVVRHRAQMGVGAPHFDIYAYLYPNVRYALASLAEGHGLLWNRLQNCGQPFFGISITALLYPFNALYLALDFPTALLALSLVHLAIGGAGMYALARVIGLSPAAALSGAAVFELGTNTLWLSYWSPQALAFYVWMPVALAAVEWLVRRPTARGATLLGTALAMQWLAGYPQASLFTYQVIALRLLWEAATAWRPGLWRVAGLVALAAIAAPLVCAIQLVPSLEVAGESLRSRPLSLEEIRVPALTVTWTEFRQFVGRRYSYGAIFGLGALMAASLAWAPRRSRSVALFYLLIAALSFALVFDTPLFTLYRSLPLGSTFREPHRFFWVTAFAGPVVVACGAEAFVEATAAGWWKILRLLPPLAAAAGYWVLSPSGLDSRELILALVLLALAVAPARGSARRLVGVALPLLLVAELFVLSTNQVFGFLTTDAMVMQHRDAFEAARARMTLQDRFYAVPGVLASRWQGLNDGVIKKAGELFQVPSIADYEPLTSARYAQLLMYMLYGRPMTSINQFVYDLRWVPTTRRLLDVMTARFVVIDVPRAVELHWPGPGFALAWERNGHRVYENLSALPRAFYVPQATAVGDPDAALRALAVGTVDPRKVALLEGPPGPILGTEGGEGTAAIVSDRSETVEVRVRARDAGYLVLADQYYPGWQATVNDVPVPIRRANYAFRLVEVPAGESRIVFRYRPMSLVVGAAVSAATVLGLFVLMWLSRRRAARFVPVQS